MVSGSSPDAGANYYGNGSIQQHIVRDGQGIDK